MTPEELSKIWLALPDGTDANDFPHRAEMIYNKDLLPVYIWACKLASVETWEKPERSLTFKIEMAHGLRRLETRESLEKASKELDAVRKDLEHVQDETRRARLSELTLYHSIWGVEHLLGNFKKCAELCKMSMVEATDELNQVRAGYHQLLFSAWDCVARDDVKKFESLLGDLAAMGEELVELAKKSKNQYHEMANVLCHELILTLVTGDVCFVSGLNLVPEIGKLQSWVLNKKITIDGFGPLVSAISAAMYTGIGQVEVAWMFLDDIQGNTEAEAFAKLISLELMEGGSKKMFRQAYNDLLEFNDKIGGHLYRIIAMYRYKKFF